MYSVMKIDNQHIQDIAKKLFHQKQGFQRVKLMHPRRDWLIGVLVGVLIICVMTGWSVYTYFEQREAISLETTVVEAEMPAYKADVVEDALTIFAERAQNFARLTGGSAVVTPEEPAEEVAESIGTSTTAIASSSAPDAPAESVAADVPDQAPEENINPDPVAEVEPEPAVTPEVVAETQTPTLVD